MPDTPPTEEVARAARTEAEKRYPADRWDVPGFDDARSVTAFVAGAQWGAALPHLPQHVRPSVEEVRDELAGWPIGSGYYQTKIGPDEAREMAQAVLALLSSQPTVDSPSAPLVDAGESFAERLVLLEATLVSLDAGSIPEGTRQQLLRAVRGSLL